MCSRFLCIYTGLYGKCYELELIHKWRFWINESSSFISLSGTEIFIMTDVGFRIFIGMKYFSHNEAPTLYLTPPTSYFPPLSLFLYQKFRRQHFIPFPGFDGIHKTCLHGVGAHLSFFINGNKSHLQRFCFLPVTVYNTLYGFSAGHFGAIALAHEFYHQVRAADSDYFFAKAAAGGGAHFIVYKKSCTNNRRITHTAMYFK